MRSARHHSLLDSVRSGSGPHVNIFYLAVLLAPRHTHFFHCCGVEISSSVIEQFMVRSTPPSSKSVETHPKGHSLCDGKGTRTEREQDEKEMVREKQIVDGDILTSRFRPEYCE